MTLPERLKLYAELTRLSKPIGILLLMWPTLWGLWLSSAGRPDGLIVWIFLLGVVLMRSAGCVINDYADRGVDRHVQRTRNRPLTTGRVRAKEALLLAGGLSLLAFLPVLLLNRLTIVLAFPALFLAASYPFTKRFFAVPQAYLGIAFGFAIPMAFAAHTGAVPPVAWALLAANTFWAIAYDTEYAMVDREDDIKIGIKTAAITFGRYDVAAVMVCYLAFLGILAGAGAEMGLGWIYFSGLGVALGVSTYHYTLIKDRQREKCFKAFLHNNWVGGAVFAGIALDYAVRYLAHP